MADELIVNALLDIKAEMGKLSGKVDGINNRLDRQNGHIDELYARSTVCIAWRATHEGCVEGQRETGMRWYYWLTLSVAALACTALLAETFFI